MTTEKRRNGFNNIAGWRNILAIVAILVALGISIGSLMMQVNAQGADIEDNAVCIKEVQTAQEKIEEDISDIKVDVAVTRTIVEDIRDNK